MKNLLVKLWKEKEGQDLTEYALLLGPAPPDGNRLTIPRLRSAGHAAL
jgi:hypothetical protein